MANRQLSLEQSSVKNLLLGTPVLVTRKKTVFSFNVEKFLQNRNQVESSQMDKDSRTKTLTRF